MTGLETHCSHPVAQTCVDTSQCLHDANEWGISWGGTRDLWLLPRNPLDGWQGLWQGSFLLGLCTSPREQLGCCRTSPWHPDGASPFPPLPVLLFTLCSGGAGCVTFCMWGILDLTWWTFPLWTEAWPMPERPMIDSPCHPAKQTEI